jgi:hypothetical protein
MKTIPIAYVAPADNAGITITLIAVPTTGTLFIMLAAPNPLLAGSIDPARLAVSALPRFSENGTL